MPANKTYLLLHEITNQYKWGQCEQMTGVWIRKEWIVEDIYYRWVQPQQTNHHNLMKVLFLHFKHNLQYSTQRGPRNTTNNKVDTFSQWYLRWKWWHMAGELKKKFKFSKWWQPNFLNDSFPVSHNAMPIVNKKNGGKHNGWEHNGGVLLKKIQLKLWSQISSLVDLWSPGIISKHVQLGKLKYSVIFYL